MSRAMMLILFLLFCKTCLAVAEKPTNRPEAYLAYPDGDFLIRNVRVIVGEEEKVADGQDILISKGMIRAIGVQLEGGPDITELDMTGHSVLPGLIHLHDHLAYMSSPFRGYDFILLDPHPFSIPKLYLYAGVTTVRTAGTDALAMETDLKRMIDEGVAVGPELFITSHIVDGPQVPLLMEAASYQQGRDFVKAQLPFGVTSIKAYSSTPPDALRGIIDEAHANNIHVAAHLGKTSCVDAARMGIDTIEHALDSCAADLPAMYDANKPFRLKDHESVIDNLIHELVKNQVVLVTTPSGGRAANYSEQARSVFAPHMRKALDAIGVEQGNRSESGNPMYKLDAKDQARLFEQKFVAAGGRLLMGADAMYLPIIPGYANQDVMVELARYFPPLKVIRMATADAASFLQIGKSKGKVKVGFEADLLIVRGKPDIHMSDIRNVSLVFKLGRAYDPEKLRRSALGRVGLD